MRLVENPDCCDTITKFLLLETRVPTAFGEIPAMDWLKSEKTRLHDKGVECEFVQSPAGRIALRRK